MSRRVSAMAQYWGTARQQNPQSVAYSASAGQTANPIGPYVTRVRIVCTTDAFVGAIDGPAFTNVTSTTGSFFPAGSVEYITVTPGQKISAIQATASGTMRVTEAV